MADMCYVDARVFIFALDGQLCHLEHDLQPRALVLAGLSMFTCRVECLEKDLRQSIVWQSKELTKWEELVMMIKRSLAYGKTLILEDNAFKFSANREMSMKGDNWHLCLTPKVDRNWEFN